MVCRLERRQRSQTSEGFREQEQRDPLPTQDAQGHHRKKITGLASIAQLAEAWSQGRRNVDYRATFYCREAWQGIAPHQLTQTHILNLVATWKKNLAHVTAYGYVYALRRFLRTVDEQHGTKLTKLVPRLATPLPRKLTCPDDVFSEILRHSPPWFRFFLRLCRVLGLRHSEAMLLTPDAFNEDTQTLNFHRKMHGTSSLPVTPEIAEAIRYARSQEPHAPILRTLGSPGETLTREVIDRAWRKARAAAGADPRLIIHDLRRTAATRIYDLTHDLRLAQQLLGHRHMSSTLLYIAPNQKAELTQAIRNAAPPDLDRIPLATEVKQ